MKLFVKNEAPWTSSRYLPTCGQARRLGRGAKSRTEGHYSPMDKPVALWCVVKQILLMFLILALASLISWNVFAYDSDMAPRQPQINLPRTTQKVPLAEGVVRGLPQINPNAFFDKLQKFNGVILEVFRSGKLPIMSGLTPQLKLKSLNFGADRGDTINTVVGIIVKIIQIVINVTILFIQQIWGILPMGSRQQ